MREQVAEGHLPTQWLEAWTGQSEGPSRKEHGESRVRGPREGTSRLAGTTSPEGSSTVGLALATQGGSNGGLVSGGSSKGEEFIVQRGANPGV